MSYVFYIWDPSRHSPLPGNRDEAILIAERLGETTDVANLKFIEFGEALVQRYQNDAAAREEHHTLPAFWGGDPRQDAVVCTSALFRLTMPSDECTRQMAHIVEAATMLGLVAFDDETGMCFLPDGTIFPEEDREMWEFNLAEMNAGTPGHNAEKSDGRTFFETLGGALFNAVGQGNNRQS